LDGAVAHHTPEKSSALLIPSFFTNVQSMHQIQNDDAPAAMPTTLARLITAGMAAMRSKVSAGTELAATLAPVTALAAERDQVRTDLAAISQENVAALERVAAIKAQIASFASLHGIDVAALAGKSGADVTAMISAKVSAFASEQADILGFPAVTPFPRTTNPANGGLLSYTEFTALSQADRMTFSCTGGRISD
jgi:hypothetical protein